jgi:hypothetical protein
VFTRTELAFSFQNPENAVEIDRPATWHPLQNLTAQGAPAGFTGPSPGEEAKKCVFERTFEFLHCTVMGRRDSGWLGAVRARGRGSSLDRVHSDAMGARDSFPGGNAARAGSRSSPATGAELKETVYLSSTPRRVLA